MYITEPYIIIFWSELSWFQSSHSGFYVRNEVKEKGSDVDTSHWHLHIWELLALYGLSNFLCWRGGQAQGGEPLRWEPGGRRHRWWKRMLLDSWGGCGVGFQEKYIIHFKNDKQENRPEQIVTEVQSHFPFVHCSFLSISLHPQASFPRSHEAAQLAQVSPPWPQPSSSSQACLPSKAVRMGDSTEEGNSRGKKSLPHYCGALHSGEPLSLDLLPQVTCLCSPVICTPTR